MVFKKNNFVEIQAIYNKSHIFKVQFSVLEPVDVPYRETITTIKAVSIIPLGCFCPSPFCNSSFSVTVC